MPAPFPSFPPPKPRPSIDVAGETQVRRVSDKEALLVGSGMLHQRLACLRNPNGDVYRREHLHDIGESGLRDLYADDLITLDELESMTAEMIRDELDPLA